MNIAFFMRPKAEVAFLYDDFTVRQSLEKMHHHGYSAIPVLNRKGEYCGTVSEGDLLWFIVKGEGNTPHTLAIEDLEEFRISEVGYDAKPQKNPAVKITSSIDELLMKAMNQNFIPIVDDRGLFIGIVTRREVIKYFYENTLDLNSDIDEDEGIK